MQRVLFAFVSALVVFRSWGGDVVETFAAPTVSCVDAGDGFVALEVEAEGYVANPAAIGAPALPMRSYLIAVPDGAIVTGVTYEASWEVAATDVRIVPVAEAVRIGETANSPVPDAVIYSGAAAYPASALAVGGEDLMAGVRVFPVAVTPFRWHPQTGLLERATSFTLRIGFAAGGTRSALVTPGMLESVRGAVLNPADVTLPRLARRALKAVSPVDEGTADYLLLSPPDFVADWTWYVGERRKVHPDVTFKVKNTAEIYADYPFGASNACRNAAESIHAYLRDHRASMGFQYVVLGGAWLDAQDRKKANPRFYGGETMSLSNCVPGVYGYPREDWREIPSDMFYACLDLKNNQRYPWDANEDGVYIDQNDCSKNDLKPDVVVTRLTLNPYRPNGLVAYNRHALVTNYVAKLARGEARDFQGHFRYGLSPDSTGSRRLRANGDRMYYDELEFYDNMYNMADPQHADQIEDNEVEPRRRIKDQFAKWRPVLEAKGMMNYTWTKGFATLAAAANDYYASNRDYGFVYSHGWAQGATHFQAGSFATCKGLTVLNGSNGPCDTGYPDYHVTMNGVPTLQYNLGDSGVTNPDGGALASINNTRWGWAGGSHTGLDFDSSMSYFMLNRSLVGFNQLYLDVGHAWFKGVSDYAAFSFTQGGGTHTWTLTEQICYGDPLVRLPAPEDRWWAGGATGVWDAVTTNWLNESSVATTYFAASNVYFNVTTDTTVTVAETVGALKLKIDLSGAQPSTPNHQPRFSIVGSNGCLRVMRELTVTGGDLYLDVPGGVGHEGIAFARAAGQTADGELTFAGTNVFYLANLAGASRVNLLGGGVTLDADKFPATCPPLVFDGPGVNYLPRPNILRSRQADGLRRFGPLAITNSYVKLETADGFGRDTPLTHTLVGSKLEIAANAFYQRKGSYQADGYAEKLSATFEVAGDSAVTSSKGGLWTVSATTTFNLATNATLAFSAETKDCGGKIILTGGGAASVKTASSLAGTVEVGPGVTLVLDELPLASVTSLTIADGACVVIPEQKNGYWQILPVSAKLNCGKSVSFYTQENRVTPLDGQPSPTGAFFKKGALYEWKATDTHWTAAIAHQYPKILFGDLPSTLCMTVAVDLAVEPSFVSFANVTSAYTFVSGSSDASLRFSSVIFNGTTRFDLPVAATEYAEILSGTNSFARLVTPKLTVAAGATLGLMGSHWTHLVLEEGARLAALPDASLDWNTDTEIEFAATAPIEIDVSSLTLTDTPQVIVRGSGHTWTTADLAHFTPVGQPAELRIVEGCLCVVRGDGLKAPYSLTFGGETNWDSRAWCAANKPFSAKWSESRLDVTASVRVAPTGEVARLALDCEAVGGTLAIATPTNGVFTLTSSAGAASPRVLMDAIDLTDAQNETLLDIDTGLAAIVGPTNAAATVTLCRPGRGTVTLSAGRLNLQAPGTWTLAAGAQGTVVVTLPPTNRVVTLVTLAEGFDYPCGGFDIEIVDTNGVRRTDAVITRVDNTLVAVPPVIDVGDIDFAALAENAVAGAPYSHGLVSGGVSSSVCLTNLPTGFTGGTNITVETSGAYGVRLVIRVPEVRLGSININFAGGRNGETNLTDSRVSDQASWCNLPHGAQPVVGTNWNDIAAVNGTFVAKRIVKADGAVETNASVSVRLTNVANPYTTGGTVGDRILYGYLDDGKSPVVELSGIPFARYRVLAYRSTDNANTVFSSCRIGTCAADALAYYGSSSRGRTAVVTLSGAANMGWGDTNVRDQLIEGVNYVVSDVLTGGTAYIASPKHTGRACLSALQIVEVPGEAPADPEEPEATVREVGTAAEAEELAASDYAGEARLLNGVTNELHKLPAYVLATGSVGRVEVRLAQVPTVNGTWLLKTAEGYDPASNAVEVVLRDQFGRAFLAPVTVCWKTGGYYLLVQNLDAPTWRHTFTGTVTDPNYNSSGLPETNDPAQFEKCREDGQALVNWYRGSTRSSLMDPFPTAWTLNIVARTPNNQNGVLFAFGYGAYTPKGFAFASGGTDRAALVVWRGWGEAYRLTANVPLATTQFHAYTVTYDGATLRFYVDGALADSRADTEGFTYVNNALNDKIGWFQFWGVCSGKYPGSLGGASGGAIDDWSFYKGTCLTPESVEALAARFPPWPQTTEATVYEEEVSWAKELVWTPTVEDWANVKAAAIEAGAAGASVLCDEPAFSNKLVLADGAKLIATNTVGFSLAPYPVGTMEFRLNDVTNSCRLVNTTSDYVSDDAVFSLAVTNTTGAMPPEPWYVTRFTDGWYWLRLQDVDKPLYSLDFNNSLSTGLGGTAQPALKDTDNAQFVAARDHAAGALTARNPYCQSGLGLHACWTLHTVAKLPAAANGVVFAYGNKSQGLALHSPSTDTVAVGYWYGSAKRGDFVTATVTNAQVQYHAYAITHTGSRLALWVDGVKVGEASASGYPNNGNAQFFSVYGGLPSGFANGQSGAIDDWRFFGECLGPKAIAQLAESFRPWPQCASFALSQPLELTQATAIVGGASALKLTGEGALVSSEGLSFATDAVIDASELDGTNLAKRAVAGAPYVRWLVRGPFTWAGSRTVKLPSVPKRYSIRAEDFSAYGVRLVVTAPQTALFESVSVSVGNDSFAGLSGTLGLYPETAGKWLAYTTWSTAAAAFGPLSVAALPMTNGQIDPDGTGLDGAPLILTNTSFDGNGPDYDGQACGYVVSNLTDFAAQYRVLVYLASNMADGGWGPVEIGGRLYTGLQQGTENEWASLSDSTLTHWGKRFATPREGVNVVISDVLTNDVIRLVGHRNYASLKARGQIAAFQIVKVGELFESEAVDYTANVTNTTAWAEGAGAGLELTGETTRWVNDAISTISLVQTIPSATLTFDTPTTASVLRVTATADQTLTLEASTNAVSIDGLDLSAAAGTVALDASFVRPPLVAGLGGCLRYLDDRGTVDAATYFPVAGRYGFEKATISGSFKGTDFAKWTIVVEEGDDVTFRSTDTYACTDFSVDVRGGCLTYSNSDVWISYAASYRQTGGLVTFGTTSGSQMRFIPGYTTTATYTMNISGGTTDVSRLTVLFDQPTAINLSGTGVFRAKGLARNQNRTHRLTLSENALLELGAGGCDYPAQLITLAGGELRSTASVAVKGPVAVTGAARLAAATGETLTLAAGVTGAGTLLCDGEGAWSGAVELKGGDYTGVTLGGTFRLRLTEAQAASTVETKLANAAEGLDSSQVTILDAEGDLATNGVVRVKDGELLWLPEADSVEVDGRRVRHAEIFDHACSTSRILFAGAAVRDAAHLRFGDSNLVAIPSWYDIHLDEGLLTLAMNTNALPAIGAVTNLESHFWVGVPNANEALWFRLEGYENLDDTEPVQVGEWMRGGNSLTCPNPTATQGFFRIVVRDYEP